MPTFEWWSLRPSPDHGYTVTEANNQHVVIAAWLPEFEVKAIVLAHNMAIIRDAELLGFGEQAANEYRELKKKAGVIL